MNLPYFFSHSFDQSNGWPTQIFFENSYTTMARILKIWAPQCRKDGALHHTIMQGAGCVNVALLKK